MKINFKGEEYEIDFSKYMDNDNTALLLKGEYEHDYIIASVNLDSLPEDTIAIKNWGGNETIESVLIDAEVIKPFILRSIPTGYVSAPVYQLTSQAVAVMKESFEGDISDA